METFCIITFIVLVIIAVAKGTNKLLGPIGCLALVILFVVMTCEYDKETREEYNISDEEESKRKMDEAVAQDKADVYRLRLGKAAKDVS